MNNLTINLIKYLSYFVRKNKKLIIFTDDLTPRLYKICSAFDDIGFEYKVFLLDNLSNIQKSSSNNIKIIKIKNKFLYYLKLLKYKGSTAHFIINSNQKFYYNLINLKIFKCYVDIYDHKFLYKETDSIKKQEEIENKILNSSDGII